MAITQWTAVGICLLAPGLLAQTTRSKLPSGLSVAEALQTGVSLLIANQELYQQDERVKRIRDDQVSKWQDGERTRLEKLRKNAKARVEWPYEGVYRVRGSIPAGYRVGGTALVCEALVLSPGFQGNQLAKAAVKRAMGFMLSTLTESAALTPGPKRGYDVRGWAHTYALKFFLLSEKRDLLTGEMAAEVKEMIRHLLVCLSKNECSSGGWNYASDRCSPFMTGSTLLALYQARAQGYKFDDGLVNDALTALERSRHKSGSYVYSGSPRSGRGPGRMSAMPGACARAAIAELCLFRAGRSDQKRLRIAVDGFFEHWNELKKRKSQQGTHIGAYGIAPYYFMYGHTYAALAIESLPESDRPALRKQMQEVLWRTREKDGGWNDRIFPRSKSYSTAMAMLALLAPSLDSVPTWPRAALTNKKKGI